MVGVCFDGYGHFEQIDEKFVKPGPRIEPLVFSSKGNMPLITLGQPASGISPDTHDKMSGSYEFVLKPALLSILAKNLNKVA